MVVINGFTAVPASTRARRSLSHTDCVFDAFDDPTAGRILELATTGSDDRVSAGKRSQTVQLDKAGAITLLGLLEEAFGDALYDSPEGAPVPADAAGDEAPAVDLNWPALQSDILLPELLHGTLEAVPEVIPEYAEQPDGELVSDRTPQKSRTSSAVNRAIEVSAVEMVKRTFTQSGWAFHADRQADGVGYDLEFVRDGQRRKVEVKGIKGSALAFNVTTKEFWRAHEDAEFVLIAVTSALDERKRRVHVVSREALVGAQRVPLSYRIGPLGNADEHLPSESSGEDTWH